MRKKEQHLDHLAAVPMFSACTKQDLRQLARVADEINVESGHTLVTEGQTGREFFVIVDGKATVTRGGREIATLGPGDYFGELALLDRAPRNATVTASTPLTILVMGQREFSGLLAEVPNIAHKLMVGMARRLHELDSKA